MKIDLSLVFERKPSHWGMRGDPFMWDELQKLCIGESLEIDEAGIVVMVSDHFKAVTGKVLTYDTNAYVERYAHGAMSSGQICGMFWLSRGITMLLDNLNRIKSGYPIVTLCGSTRFKEQFMDAQKRLTLEGNIVISVGLFGHSGDQEV